MAVGSILECVELETFQPSADRLCSHPTDLWDSEQNNQCVYRFQQ